MPRQSAESRAAAAFAAGASAPLPPPHLGKEAAEVWRSIAASKPSDWFDAGAQILLAAYCDTAAQDAVLSKKIGSLWRQPNPDQKILAQFERRQARNIQLLARLASALRLSVQSAVDWHSRKKDERGAGLDPEHLIGGEAVRGRKAN
jgi:phage terminase small subunit